jgi:hypothetical protein
LGDLDGDGDLDAFVANGSFNDDQANEVWLNDGAGIFSSPYSGLGGGRSTALDLGDVDGDGDLDAFITNREGQANEVWLNDGRGLFGDSDQRLGEGDSWDVRLGDLDGDGDLDAWVANANLYGEEGGANRIWLNDGAGAFTPTDQRLGSSVSLGVNLGDLDGDGDLDAFVGNAATDVAGGEPNRVWLNSPARLFLPIVMADGGPYYEVTNVRQLTACENMGRHHIFIHVVDRYGDGLAGIPLRVAWSPEDSDAAYLTTDETGWAVFVMYSGTYSVQVDDGTSQAASGLTPDFAADEVCEETGAIGNSRFHISFEVIFTRVW